MRASGRARLVRAIWTVAVVIVELVDGDCDRRIGDAGERVGRFVEFSNLKAVSTRQSLTDTYMGACCSDFEELDVSLQSCQEGQLTLWTYALWARGILLSI